MSRYAMFRRRLAPVAFGVAIVLLSRETCNKQQRTHATVVVDFGDAMTRVRAVDAELVGDDGSSLGILHRVALDGATIGPTTFAASLPAPDAEVRIDVDLGATHRHVTRHIHADDGATVTISIGDDLR